MDTYKDRWLSLFKGTNNHSSALSVFEILKRRYSEKHRKYHNFSHIADCLRHLDRIKDHLAQPRPVELALWFHDVIYNTKSKRNEEKSAEMATRELSKLGLDREGINQVSSMVLVTKHPGNPGSEDEKYVLDIDLAVLGSSPEVFLEYESNIRREYKWVPGFVYKRQRSEILESFLSRDRIYQTDYFYNQREEAARRNIRNSLNDLQ